MLDESQRSLVTRLQHGDDTAYEEIVRSHAGRMLSVAMRLVGNDSDAEEVLQEAFVAAWRGIRGFDGRSAFATWLHRITVNAALARLRQRGRRQEVSMDDIEHSGDQHDERPGIELAITPDNPLEQAELRRIVWRAVDALSDEYRTVLILRDVENMSSKEVAAQLGLSDAAVRQTLHRARQAVAEQLRPQMREAPRITCGGKLELLFDHIDSVLVGDVGAQVADHLHSCGTCQMLLGAYELTVAAPRTWVHEVSAERSEAIVASMLGAAHGVRGHEH